MKFLIQRVNQASIRVSGNVIATIENGLCVFVGIAESDTQEIAKKMLNKLYTLRIFSNEKGLFDRSIQDIKGSLMFVPQFTLYASCQKGRRPHFSAAARPQKAKPLFDFIYQSAINNAQVPVTSGQFAADMKVSLTNDGPVTLELDSQDLF